MTAGFLARALRLTDEFRQHTVHGMLERHHTEAASYWTQLALSTGIATFGLVLNSGAVIIGAMLVAPLMGPIIELAMGLAVGSALLAIRSTIRVAISIAVAVLSAAALTRMLPFHEVTTEIAGRTSPTVLDLMVASFCALTAAFVTLKPHDTMSTAAGTSISISLVPPLCASGFGLGVGLPHVAWGALLLFTANFSAILLFAVLVFLLAGFGNVDNAAMEREVIGEAERQGAVMRVATRLNVLFGSRRSAVLKLFLPVALVAAVFDPLQRALSTVSAEVRARKELSVILNTQDELKNALLTSIAFDREGLTVRLAVVGEPARAQELEKQLREQIASRIGGNAAVSVVGVADAALVARLATAAQAAPIPAPPPLPPQPPPLAELKQRVAAAITESYPEKEAGPLVGWSLEGSNDTPTLRLTHLGEPLGPAATKLLGQALAAPLRGPVDVVETALSPRPRAFADGAALIAEIGILRAQLASFPALWICAEVPGELGRMSPLLRKQAEAARASLGLPAGDVHEGSAWALRVADKPCGSREGPT